MQFDLQLFSWRSKLEALCPVAYQVEDVPAVVVWVPSWHVARRRRGFTPPCGCVVAVLDPFLTENFENLRKQAMPTARFQIFWPS